MTQPLLPHRSLSFDQAAEGVRQRLSRGDPVGAWEWAVGCGRWRVFLIEATGRSGSGLMAPPQGWGGEAEAWRRAGELCAAECEKVFGPRSSELAYFLMVSRVEFFQGAARVIPQEGWLAQARIEVARVGLGAETARDLKSALLTLGPEFQDELMRLDWGGRRALAWEQDEFRRSAISPSGMCAMAQWESVEPLARAAEFLSERGVDWQSDIIRPTRLGGPLACAVASLSEPGARWLLNAAPGASASRDTEASLVFWRDGVDTLLESNPQELYERRKAFAERLDLEAGLSPAEPRARALGL